MSNIITHALFFTALWLSACANDMRVSRPLHEAVFAVFNDTSNLARIKFLVEKEGCSPNAKNLQGETPLHVAFQSLGKVFDHPENKPMAEVVKYLLSKGADPNIPFPEYGGIKGYTLLHFAAYDGNMVLVPMLVEAGAAVNAKDERGFTPLHSAARCDFRLSCDDCSPYAWKAGAKPVIQYLLNHGADIRIHSKDGESVLDIVPTPCSYDATLCKAGSISSETWPSGTCQMTYLFVKAALDAAQAKDR